MNGTCTTAGCDRNVVAKGLCGRHYQAQWTPQRPGFNQTRSGECSVDECDRGRFRHGLCRDHYRRSLRYGSPTGGPEPRVAQSDYRSIWRRHNGPIPQGHEIHHKDMDRSNNAPDNLVALTISDHKLLHSGHLEWACQVCHSTEKPHFALGKCRACYIREKRAEQRAQEGKMRY